MGYNEPVHVTTSRCIQEQVLQHIADAATLADMPKAVGDLYDLKEKTAIVGVSVSLGYDALSREIKRFAENTAKFGKNLLNRAEFFEAMTRQEFREFSCPTYVNPKAAFYRDMLAENGNDKHWVNLVAKSQIPAELARLAALKGADVFLGASTSVVKGLADTIKSMDESLGTIGFKASAADTVDIKIPVEMIRSWKEIEKIPHGAPMTYIILSLLSRNLTVK